MRKKKQKRTSSSGDIRKLRWIIGRKNVAHAVKLERQRRRLEQLNAATAVISDNAKIEQLERELRAAYAAYQQLDEKYHELAARKDMNEATFKRIWFCLHPDRVQDPELKARFEEAFKDFEDFFKRT
jgi:hypothetical protein